MSHMKGLVKLVSMVFEVMELTILKDGQLLHILEIEISVFLKSLPDEPTCYVLLDRRV